MCKDFIIIAGPCSVESEAQVITTARELQKEISPDYFRAGIWKPRTRPGSFEGVGEKGLEWLQFVQDEIGINVITEAGCANHVEKLSKYDMQYLENMELVYIATHEGEYSHDFVKKLIQEDTELQKVKAHFDDDTSEGYAYYRNMPFSRVMLYEYSKTNFYRAFNYIFGWGMNTSEWGSTSGQAFVDEIVEIIEPIFKEKEATARAYRQAYYD